MAQKYYDELINIIDDEDVLFYPADELITADMIMSTGDFKFERINTILSLLSDKKKIVVTNYNGAIRYQFNKNKWINNNLHIKVNDSINIEELLMALLEMGYKNVYTTTKTGEFSRRGSIVDIFPLNNDNPIRLDFFGDDLEELKVFDSLTQVSIKRIDNIDIYPVCEMLYSDKELEIALKRLDDFILNNKLSSEELKKYDDSILKYLPRPRILPWEEEGITNEVIQRNNIAYDPVNEGIVIPHYNIDGKLIGIRERTLIKEEETKGKYRPAIIAGTMYNHPLGFTLYNLNNSKTHIKDMKKVFLFESEKSCLLYQSYFGFENDISCACCGSSFIKYQLDLLLSLGVKEVIISFDKQFKELGDEECSKWTKKLRGFYQKYSPYVTISFLFDKSNLLDYKMSPIDNGPENFLQLYKNRIFL